MAPSPASAQAQTGSRFCSVCSTEIQPNMHFCHNCGAPAQEGESLHSPTMRAGSYEQLDANGQATQLASASAAYAPPDNQGQMNTADPGDEQETVRASTPSPSSTPLPASGAAPAPEAHNEE